MPLIRVLARRAAFLLAAITVSLGATAWPGMAQDAESGGEATPADTAAPPKAKPKPKPAPKPAPKATPKAASQAAQPAASAAVPALAVTQGSAWPAGATSVSESYGDWTVSCVRPEARANCIIVQSQGDSKTGQRKFGFELSVPKDGRAEGVILMPFGMAIDPGVTFKLDEQALGKGAPFSTCTGDGCLVPISFPTLATDGMRKAKSLTVTGQKSGNNEPATIVVPLVGFPQAFDRATALSG